MTPRSDPPPVHTGHVRAYLRREPAKTRGTARLILALCAEIDRLRAQQCADGEAMTAVRGDR